LFDRFADRKRREFEQREDVPPDAVWRIRWSALMEAAWASIAQVIADAQTWEPAYIELGLGAVGRGGDPASTTEPMLLPLPDGSILAVRGVIDRVDFSRAGASARIVDYKSGKMPIIPKSGGKTNRGQLLQVLLYAHGLNGWLERTGAVRSLTEAAYHYLRTSVPADAPDVPPPFDILSFEGDELEAALAELGSALGIIVPCIIRGEFLPLPGDPPNANHSACSRCDVADVCGSLPELSRRWRTYRNDARAAAFMALRTVGTP
jgi:hypothetical protein